MRVRTGETYEAIVQPRSDRSDRATASVALSLSVAQERVPVCCYFISRAMPQRSWDRLG